MPETSTPALTLRLSRRRALALGATFGAALIAAPALAQNMPTAMASTVLVPGVGPVTVLTYKARVVSMDPKTRRLVLEGASGKRWAVRVPLIAGDINGVRNNQQLLIRLVPGVVTALGKARQGKPGEVVGEVAVEDGLPGWPQGFGVRRVTITTILVNIDKSNGSISFEGPDGQVRTIKAVDQQVLNNMAQVQLGDLCQITYLEALAINAI
ncbi:hypothetical protein GCM10007301_40810 [Azorhizobium oxalatiphilum]|uniref:Uncharacterized protein n=1 Tax=Azorhizobium oxalatiphilum TaxID=980631 RepID=A0A917C972_9HYPH|nr:hypothetical protein [Azorhizobium oxalatiphilum]GGF76777.1 hypothetical protein GCM10007301_40810 [Azorhizobium oxalatiphilum]